MKRVKSKPTTPGVRHALRMEWGLSGVQEVEKSLVVANPGTGGRNNRGRVTSFNVGGGHKRQSRVIETPYVWPVGRVSERGARGVDVRERVMCRGRVIGLQYNPGAKNRLALVEPEVGVRASGGTREVSGWVRRFYMVSAEGQSVGDVVTWPMSSKEVGTVPESEWTSDARLQKARVPGAVVCLRDVSVGASVYNVEMTPGSGGKMIRSGGTHGMIQRVSETEAWIRLPSGAVRRFSLECRATVGKAFGENHALEMLGKAGVSRHMSIRPRTRGCAKNPIDHPHGGRTRGGRPEMTPWARIAKGKPTRPTKSVFVVV